MAFEFNPLAPFINSPTFLPPSNYVEVGWRGAAAFDSAALEGSAQLGVEFSSEAVAIARASSSSARISLLAEGCLATSRFSLLVGGVARLTFWGTVLYGFYQGVKFLKNELYNPVAEGIERLPKSSFFIPSLYRIPTGIVSFQRVSGDEEEKPADDDPYRGDPNADAPYFPTRPRPTAEEINKQTELGYREWVGRKGDPQNPNHWEINIGLPRRDPKFGPWPEIKGPIESD